MEAALVRSISGNANADMSVHKAILENGVELLAIACISRHGFLVCRKWKYCRKSTERCYWSGNRQ
jgi:hypothetical protein